MPTGLTVLYEDNHCLAVFKPARMPTAPDSSGDASLLDRAKDYLKRKYQKPGNVFLGLVHRLDRPVSGVVLFARTSKAAARLSEQFRSGAVRKIYHAIVEGSIQPAPGELCDWLLKQAATNTVHITAPNTPGAKRSTLKYRQLKTGCALTLLEITPLTGRSHQIRVQLAHAGHPIYGDGKYGSPHALRGAIALHATELTVQHPVRGDPLSITAPMPNDWTALLQRRGG